MANLPPSIAIDLIFPMTNTQVNRNFEYLTLSPASHQQALFHYLMVGMLTVALVPTVSASLQKLVTVLIWV